MAFIFPFITDKFTAYADAGETTTTKLSLAVLVRNGANDQFITEGIKVSLLGDKIYQPVQNLSGYYCFIDMPVGKYKLIVQSNSVNGDQFFNEEKPVDIPLIDELDPVQEVKLIPKPSYLFSANATLLRGTVSRKPKGINPVANATVSPRYQGEQDDPKIIMKTRTNDAGEFVLLLKQIKFENGGTKKIIKNISIDIKDKDGKSISITTNDLLKNKPPFLEGGTGVIVIENFPEI